MRKNKVLYSDIKSPYDDEARRWLKIFTLLFLAGLLVVGCLIIIYGL